MTIQKKQKKKKRRKVRKKSVELIVCDEKE